MLCKQLMHQFVVEELRRLCTTPGLGENLSLALEMESEQQQEGEEAKWHDLVRAALERSFQRMNRLRQHTCTCENITDGCRCGFMILTPPVAAVVAILTARNVVIANSGTSRAVLGRAGSSLPVFDNSKVMHAYIYFLKQFTTLLVKFSLHHIPQNKVWYVAPLFFKG